MVRSKGAVAIPDQSDLYYTPSMQKKTPLSVRTDFQNNTSPLPRIASSLYSPAKTPKAATPKKSTNVGFKSFNPARAYRFARDSILPSYYSSSNSPTKKESSPTEISRPMEISAPTNVNPQFAHLIKPDNAHHPAQRIPEAPLPGGWV